MDILTVKSFNFNSLHFIVVTKLKHGSSQTIYNARIQMDKGSNSNLMAKKMFKVLSKKHSMAELAQYKDIGVCRVTVMHKDKQNPCRFFVVPGGGQALLGIPDVETLELLGVNCNKNRAKPHEQAVQWAENTR